MWVALAVVLFLFGGFTLVDGAPGQREGCNKRGGELKYVGPHYLCMRDGRLV